MKLIKCLVLPVVLFLIAPTWTYADTWENIYSGETEEYSYSAVQTPDGGFVVAGKTNSFGNGMNDLLLLKLDTKGTIVWQKTYGGESSEEAAKIIQLSTGGYVVAGSTYTYGISDYDYWVIKFDADFNIIWQKYYDSSSSNTPRSIAETSDNGFILAGKNGSSKSDFWILKLESDGTVDWQKSYDGEGEDDIAFSAIEIPGGGYFVAGQSEAADNPDDNIDILLLKLDASGETIWEKTYGGQYMDYVRSMEQTSDGNFVVLGYTYSYGSGMVDAYLLKVDPSDGSILWQKAYGGHSFDYASSIKETKNEDLLLAGRTLSFGGIGSDGWLLRLDSGGNILWQKAYVRSGSEDFSDAQETSDGNIFISGYIYNDFDIYTLKVNANGEIPRCQSCTDTDATTIIPDMVPVDADVTVTELAGASGDTPVIAENAGLVATNICYAASPNVPIFLLLF